MIPRPWSLAHTVLLVGLAGIGLCGIASNRVSPREPVVQTQDSPPAKSEPPTQPLPYSHKKHVSIGLRCQDCHPNPEPGDRMTFPATSKCMTCHSSIAKGKPSIQKLAEFSKAGTPVPWVRVYSVPSWVYWNHRSHLDAKMTCEMCHGKVQELDTMAKTTNVVTMAGCIDCHKKNDANTGCKYCHSDK